MSSRIVPDDVVDRSRVGFLVHSVKLEGRGVVLVTYVEGLQGSGQPRYAVESHIICRTAEQAAELVRVLMSAMTGATTSGATT